MHIEHIDEESGIVWYNTLDYKGAQIEVVCYGLQIEQFKHLELAERFFKSCQAHAKQAKNKG